MTHTPEISMTNSLRIGYRETIASAPDDITLEPGTHYLLARNGRGKTTLLRTLAGVLKPLGGGFSNTGRCQFLSEDIDFDRELPAKVIFKSLLPKKAYAKALEFGENIELDMSKPYGKLSTGNKRKVALMLAEFSVIDGGGEILLLDEPFTGLDAHAREAFQKLWQESGSDVLRLVSCHPDYDSMKVESAIMISDGAISHIQGEERLAKWGEIKNELN